MAASYRVGIIITSRDLDFSLVDDATEEIVLFTDNKQEANILMGTLTRIAKELNSMVGRRKIANL